MHISLKKETEEQLLLLQKSTHYVCTYSDINTGLQQAYRVTVLLWRNQSQILTVTQEQQLQRVPECGWLSTSSFASNRSKYFDMKEQTANMSQMVCFSDFTNAKCHRTPIHQRFNINYHQKQIFKTRGTSDGIEEIPKRLSSGFFWKLITEMQKS